MITKLFFQRSKTSKSPLRPHRKILSGAFILGMLFLSPATDAQTSVIVPDISFTGTFLGPLTNSTRNYQLIIDDSQLTALAGQYLTSIALRLPTTVSTPWPAADTTFPDYQIYMSNGVEPANRQLDFAANRVGAQTQVRSGNLLIPANAFSAGSDFMFTINFTTPYLYTTGTNLVVEIRHTGSNGTSSSVYAAGTGATGYGSLYTACWSSTGGVTQGNFAYIKISSGSILGTKSVEIDGTTSVYPNPVKDQLYVKSPTDVTEVHIFNMTGQKVFSRKNPARDQQLDVSGLAKGNYILQSIDRNGNSKSTKFIKE